MMILRLAGDPSALSRLEPINQMTEKGKSSRMPGLRIPTSLAKSMPFVVGLNLGTSILGNRRSCIVGSAVVVSIVVSSISLFPRFETSHRSLDTQVEAKLSLVRSTNKVALSQDGPASLTGITSCAASGCHGKPEGSQPAWKSSYRVWASRDPHAQSFSTLWNDRSKQIVGILAESNGSATNNPTQARPIALDAKQHWLILKERCTLCHSTAIVENASMGLAYTDGVSCQSCHGAAEHWLGEHIQKRWADKEKADLEKAWDYKKALGLHRLNDLTVRCDTCVGCHIGAPGKEVNHDLIAAGHPRLVFDFPRYMNMLPTHWDEAKPGGHALWAIGQRQSALASLRLINHHAANTSSQSAWPEFSDYNCLSCHRDLGAKGKSSDLYQSAQHPNWELGAWYFPGYLGWDLKKLDDEFARPYPNRQAVVDSTNEVAIPKLLTSENSGAMFEAITVLPRTNNWDELAQWHLTVNAIIAEMKPRFRDLSQLESLNEQLMLELKRMPHEESLDSKLSLILSKIRDHVRELVNKGDQ